ncbi:MAG: flavin reductase family protein [Bacteroidia bacterium]|nr:flavin reductase family protein [Bacteroidia bacterium]
MRLSRPTPKFYWDILTPDGFQRSFERSRSNRRKSHLFIRIMLIYTARDLERADRGWRINFINCLIGVKNLHVLITRNTNRTYNAAIFNSGLHLGSSPPFVGFLLRPTTVPRHTYENLRLYPFATLNAVSEGFYKKAHQTHLKLPYGESELDLFGLALDEGIDEDIPYLTESPLRARLRLVEEHLLTMNQTRLLVFAVETVHIAIEPDSDGFFRLDDLHLVAGSGCDAYWQVKYLSREPLHQRR